MIIKPNLLVETNALLLLEKMKPESLDMVYLDPPWPNNESVYDADKRDYRTFIYQIIQQCHRVLKATGNIFLYSRPDLNLDFGNLLKDVFGTHKFVTEFVIPQLTYSHSPSSDWHSHASILFYRKSENSVQNRVYKIKDSEFAKYFNHSDKKGKYRFLSITVPSSMANFLFSWHGATPPKGQSWRFSRDQLDRFFADNLIYQNEKGTFFLKKYLDDEILQTPVGTVWDDLSSIKKKMSLPTQQSVELLERIIQIGTQEQHTVLDPFCGSGTTLKACINLERKFIACDNNADAIATCKGRLATEEQTVQYSSYLQSEISNLPTIWSSYKSDNLQEEDEVLSLIMKGESETVEFKESACWNYHVGQKDPNSIDKVTKTIAAYLNAFGGTLFLGVRDDGTLIDLQADYEAADRRRKNRDGYTVFLTNNIRKKLGPSVIQKYEIQFFNINQCDICRIRVKASKDLIFWEDHFYSRIDNRSAPLTCAEFLTFLKNRALV